MEVRARNPQGQEISSVWELIQITEHIINLRVLSCELALPKKHDRMETVKISFSQENILSKLKQLKWVTSLSC